MRAFLVYEQNTDRDFDVRKYVNPSTCNTPLQVASSAGCIDAIKFLVDLGADVDYLSPIAERTPLMSASENRHCEAVSLLLSLGADVNKEYGGMTALGISLLKENNFSVIETLQCAGAKVSSRELENSRVRHAFAMNYVIPKWRVFCAGTDAHLGWDSPVQLLAGFSQITAFICNQSFDLQFQRNGCCVELP